MDWESGASWGVTRDDPIFEQLIQVLEDIDKQKLKREPRPVHIVIEAAHAAQLGRPAELVMREIMHSRSVEEARSYIRTDGKALVKFHFIEDRIRIPMDLDGHIICIGGPRSNVIARAAMEYELDFAASEPLYRKINSPALDNKISYMTHGKTVDHHMVNFEYSILDQVKFEFDEYELQSKIFRYVTGTFDPWRNKSSRWRRELPDGLELGPSEITLKAAAENTEDSTKEWQLLLKNYRLYSPGRFFQIPAMGNDDSTYQGRSLSIREKSRPELQDGFGESLKEWIFYDQTKLTIMPNVFSSQFSNQIGGEADASEKENYGDRLIIYQGLRSLGTLASLFMIRDKKHIEGLKQRIIESLEVSEKTYKARNIGGKKVAALPLFERVWSVYRDLEYRQDGVRPNPIGGERQFADGTVRWARPKLCPGPAEVEQAFSKWKKRQGESLSPVPSKVSATTLNTIKSFKEFSCSLKPDQSGRLAQSLKRALVQTNQINADQLLDAMALHRKKDRAHDGIYVLGCFENQKTFYTQQCRAFTLIHALHKAGKVHPGRKVVIVGAGPSGIAAAVAAAKTGLRVVLLDEHAKFDTKFEGAGHRYVHPYSFDWPFPQRSGERSDLPGMDWDAGSAHDVWSQIKEKFEAVRADMRLKKSDQQSISVVHNFRARSYFYDELNDRHCLTRLCPEDYFNDKEKGGVLAEWLRAQPGVATNAKRVSGASDPEADAFAQEYLDDLILENIARMYKPESGMRRRLEDWKAGSKGSSGKKVGNAAAVAKGLSLLRHPEIIDGDILIFATGYGLEDPASAFLELIDLGFERPTKDTQVKAVDEFKAAMLKASSHNSATPNNSGYWEDDREAFERIVENLHRDHARVGVDGASERRTVIVSGSGDGALIDILRLCIRDFDKVGEKMIKRLMRLIAFDEDLEVHETAELGRMQASSAAEFRTLSERDIASRLKRAAKAMDELLKSDKFRSMRSEARRIDELEKTLAWPEMGDIFDELGVELNPVLVYNVDLNQQPFGPDSSTLNRMLVFALYRAQRVKFFQGKLVGKVMRKSEPEAEPRPAKLSLRGISDKTASKWIKDGDLELVWEIHRWNNGHAYPIEEPQGIIVRHGIGDQPAEFLEIAGLIRSEYDERSNSFVSREKVIDRIYREGRSLIAFLKLTSGLHPESYKFYNYTVRALE